MIEANRSARSVAPAQRLVARRSRLEDAIVDGIFDGRTKLMDVEGVRTVGIISGFVLAFCSSR
jgi:hypothetical protein